MTDIVERLRVFPVQGQRPPVHAVLRNEAAASIESLRELLAGANAEWQGCAAELEQANRRIVAMGEMNDALAAERDALLVRNEELRSANGYAELEAERDTLRSRQSCEGEQPYVCHALATARSRLAEAERERDILRDALNTVLNIPDMTDAQLEELKANCRKVIADSAEKAKRLDALRELQQESQGMGLYDTPDSASAVVCNWSGAWEGEWHADCGLVWCCEDGTPTANAMAFCPKCGKPLIEHPYVEPPVCDECGEELENGKCPDCTSADQPDDDA